MGIFKTNFVERLHNVANGLSRINTNDRPGATFNTDIKELEQYDLQCIRLMQRLSGEGHLPEKFRKLLVTQFLVLLERLEHLKVDNQSLLDEIKSELEAFVMIELTSEKIGIEVNRPLYNGTGIAGITRFHLDVTDYMGMDTLGSGIYATDSKKMAINYAFYRYNRYLGDSHMTGHFGRRLRPTVYTLKYKKHRNYVADLDNPRKLRAIYKDLRKFCVEEEQKLARNPVLLAYLHNFIGYLDFIIERQSLFRNLRGFLFAQDYPANVFSTFQSQVYQVTNLLKKIGYHGLRCMEAGEPLPSVYPWKGCMSYVIFNPENVEIVSEEHFKLVNGTVVND